MFSQPDTIVAIATPPGRGGIGVVRVSGPDAERVAGVLGGRAEPFEARRATLVRILGAAADEDLRGAAIDQAIVTCFRAPHSYTGENVAEISAHGSPVLLQQIVAAAIRAGARLAQPGEFTLRAFLNGRLDLVQAEAVRDLVEAVTPAQARAAFDQLEGTLTREIEAIERRLFELTARLEASLDFPGEGYHFVEQDEAARELRGIRDRLGDLLGDVTRGRLVREGLQVVIAGRPNTGKSSLFNRLAGVGRAIVTDVPGTTRDLVSEVVDIEGIPVTLVDTAGLRPVPSDPIEAEGIARATAARRVAALTVIVLDRSQPLTDDDRAVLDEPGTGPRVIVANKCDLVAAWSVTGLGGGVVEVSAATGDGMPALRRAVLQEVGSRDPVRDAPAITNVRHAVLLAGARDATARAAAAAADGVPEEFVLADVNDARALLEEVTGRRTPDDVLAEIFDKFCIGK
jgi:tRNA modification GTPase